MRYLGDRLERGVIIYRGEESGSCHKDNGEHCSSKNLLPILEQGCEEFHHIL